MKYKRRKFTSNECLHIYQRTVNGVNIFYDYDDMIVFYTIFSVLSRFYKVKVLELCLMVDHIHALVSAETLSSVTDFIRHYTSLFVMEYNQSIGRRGALFHKSFGSAPKVGSKKIRSTIVYIGNNPVEKKLCPMAEEYRWNFLAYMNDSNPFSESIPSGLIRGRLRDAKAEVKGTFARNAYIGYSHIGRLFDRLTESEREYLVDFIVSRYYPFDNEMILSFYDNHDQMIHAMKSVAGGEYDIKEIINPGSDMIYHDMIKYVRNELGITPVRRVITLPEEQKLELAVVLRNNTLCTKHELSKFLHLNMCGA